MTVNKTQRRVIDVAAILLLLALVKEFVIEIPLQHKAGAYGLNLVLTAMAGAVIRVVNILQTPLGICLLAIPLSLIWHYRRGN